MIASRFIPSSRPGRRSQTGLTLVELMIAILVFSFGMLGLVGLQARATQYSVSAEDSNRAALLANELAATMENTNGGTVVLPPATIAAWAARVADTAANGLPNGAGAVAVADDVATITITWRAPGSLATTDHRYVTQVVLP